MANSPSFKFIPEQSHRLPSSVGPGRETGLCGLQMLVVSRSHRLMGALLPKNRRQGPQRDFESTGGVGQSAAMVMFQVVVKYPHAVTIILVGGASEMYPHAVAADVMEVYYHMAATPRAPCMAALPATCGCPRLGCGQPEAFKSTSCTGPAANRGGVESAGSSAAVEAPPRPSGNLQAWG